jgi:23S rRNA (cytidine1920-2'-O)/16S rRNA (cytidine1409-2'-O)-methyltransferase
MNTKPHKTRLDKLLVDLNYFDSRQKAQAAIMAGIIFVNNDREDKPGTQIPVDARIEVKGSSCPYVSRGGLKLEKALLEFQIDPANQVCLDIGASTGGFTDCLLQNNATKVYAIDVGYGQLDWRLRNDPRVMTIERTNIRYLQPDELYNDNSTPRATLSTIDVSFISLTKVLPNISGLMAPDKTLIALIKPQFEAGKNQVPKTGVVKDKQIHCNIIENIFIFCENIHMTIHNLTYSPVKGPSGNIEYLIHFSNRSRANCPGKPDIQSIVTSAHQDLT